MIVVAIIALSAVVLTALYAVLVGFPSFPTQVNDGILQIIDYISQGSGFVLWFTYSTGIRAMIRVTLAYEVIVNGYKFVMWVAKKIPMFGVSD